MAVAGVIRPNVRKDTKIRIGVTGMQEDWEITVGAPDVVEARGSTVLLEWPLNKTPDPEWIQFLVYSDAPKSGSMTFIAHNPQLIGNKLRMFMEDRDVEAAARYIEQSVPLANQKFEAQVVARRRREADQATEQEAASMARMEQVRERLRKLNGSDED